LTIADINLSASINTLFRYILDEKRRKNLPNLEKWFDAISSNKAFLNNVGRPRKCKVAFHIPEPAEKHEEKHDKKH